MASKINRKSLIAGLYVDGGNDAVTAGLAKLDDLRRQGVSISVAASAPPVTAGTDRVLWIDEKVRKAREKREDEIAGMTAVEKMAARLLTDADVEASIRAAGDRARKSAERSIGTDRAMIAAFGALDK